MSSDKMYQAIRAIRKAKGRALKKVLLAEHPELKEILRLTYNPYIRYNMVPTSAWQAMPGEQEFSDYTYQLLSRLGSGALTGNAARSAVRKHLNELSYSSGMLLLAILNKTLDFGLAIKSINSVFPGLIPTHPIQLAKPFNPNTCVFPCFISPKLDGLRAVYKNGQFYSRQGHVFQGLSVLASEMERLLAKTGRDIEFDGELMVDGEHFDEISGKIRAFTEADDAHYHIYDIPNHGTEQRHRIATLQAIWFGLDINLPHISLVPHVTVTSLDVIYGIYEEYIKQGYEGAMIKKENGIYYDGRSDNWQKLKNTSTVDCKIIDVFEGEGKYSGMCGGLVVKFNGLRVRVGSGISDRQRHYWWLEPEEIIGRTAEIAYHEVTPNGSLRHPRFKSIRGDK